MKKLICLFIVLLSLFGFCLVWYFEEGSYFFFPYIFTLLLNLFILPTGLKIKLQNIELIDSPREPQYKVEEEQFSSGYTIVKYKLNYISIENFIGEINMCACIIFVPFITLFYKLGYEEVDRLGSYSEQEVLNFSESLKTIYENRLKIIQEKYDKEMKITLKTNTIIQRLNSEFNSNFKNNV